MLNKENFFLGGGGIQALILMPTLLPLGLCSLGQLHHSLSLPHLHSSLRKYVMKFYWYIWHANYVKL